MPPPRRKTFAAELFGLVAICHLAALASVLLSVPKASLAIPPAPVIDVTLAPPLRKPPVERRPSGGNGSAAPSVIHVVEAAAPLVSPFPPPEVAALEPHDTIVGLATTTAPAPGMGLGRTGDGRGHGAGTGDGEGDGSARYTDIRWLRQLTEEEVLRYYPVEAARDRVTGSAVLRCRVRLNTRVERCRIIAQEPLGYGLGHAALRASKHFRIQPPTIDGTPIDRFEIDIPVTFQPRP